MDIKKIRENMGLNQSAFWNPIGVTQSGGSRYESGRSMPPLVQYRFAKKYGTKREATAALKRLGL